MTETILILQPIGAELRDIITAELSPGFVASFTESDEPAALKAKLADADYVVFWDIGLPADLLHAAPRLKLAHKWGVASRTSTLMWRVPAPSRLRARLAATRFQSPNSPSA